MRSERPKTQSSVEIEEQGPTNPMSIIPLPTVSGVSPALTELLEKAVPRVQALEADRQALYRIQELHSLGYITDAELAIATATYEEKRKAVLAQDKQGDGASAIIEGEIEKKTPELLIQRFILEHPHQEFTTLDIRKSLDHELPNHNLALTSISQIMERVSKKIQGKIRQRPLTDLEKTAFLGEYGIRLRRVYQFIPESHPVETVVDIDDHNIKRQETISPKERPLFTDKELQLLKNYIDAAKVHIQLKRYDVSEETERLFLSHVDIGDIYTSAEKTDVRLRLELMHIENRSKVRSRINQNIALALKQKEQKKTKSKERVALDQEVRDIMPRVWNYIDQIIALQGIQTVQAREARIRLRSLIPHTTYFLFCTLVTYMIEPDETDEPYWLYAKPLTKNEIEDLLFL